MANQEKVTHDWSDEILRLNNLLDELIDHMETFDDEADGNGAAGHAFRVVIDSVRRIKRSAQKVQENLVTGIGRKLVAHQQLTEEEFHLMCARGCNYWSAKDAGIASVTDYELYQNCCIENESGRFYLIPGEMPPEEEDGDGASRRTVRIRLGVSPEEVRLSDLTVLQRIFFETRAPHIYERFMGDRS